MRFNTQGAHAPDWTFDQALRPVSHILRHGIEPPWRAPTDAERAELLGQIGAIDGPYHVSANTRVAFTMPPWYADTPLVRLVDPAWGDASIYYLVVNERLYRLNGTSVSLHEANLRAPVRITYENALEYLKAFCFFVRGDEGPFFVLERPDHPILTFEMDAPTAATFAATARQASCAENDEDDFICEAAIFYGAALFEATFVVYRTGMVEMTDDEPLAAALPVRFVARLGLYS